MRRYGALPVPKYDVLSVLLSTMSVPGLRTTTVALAWTDPDVAVIVVVPLVSAVTTPFAFTEATPVLLEVHVIGAPMIGFPAPLVSWAVYWSVCPRAVIVSNVELSTIVVGLFVTTTMAESRRTPATAWMTVLPTATDVSNAFEVTVAIVGSLLLQVAALAGNDCPRAFRICTGMVIVSPIDGSVSLRFRIVRVVVRLVE